jgi:hypothetical protein
MGLTSAIPAFLDACGKLAGEAAARGDVEEARRLLALASRLADDGPT